MRYRVLIADDNPYVRLVIRAFLEQREDVEVCAEAANGTEAVELALAHDPQLLILDVVMPGMNGIEASTVLKEKLPNAKTILFTMYGDAVPRLAAAASVDVLLPKPEGITSLVKVVNDLLAGYAKQGGDLPPVVISEPDGRPRAPGGSEPL